MDNDNDNVAVSPFAAMNCYAMWQPIETAPKNGSAILLYPCGIFGAVSPDIGYWNRDKDYEAWRTLDGERIEPSPSHWMPLPTPPEGA